MKNIKEQNNNDNDKYVNEDIISTSFNDISYKLLENIDKIDVSELKFPTKEFDCILSGGGFKGYYLFGAAQILKKMIKNKQIKIRKYIGVSIGAIVSVFLLSDIPIHIIRNIYEFARHNNKYDLNQITIKACQKILPENIHELCNNKIKILVSELTFKGMVPVYIEKFNSKEHLLKVIQATCYIPYLTSTTISGVKIDDKIYYDGAFTNNVPIIKNNDIPQLVFHTRNVEYKKWYMFNTKDKCPELLILRGAIEMERFIKHLYNIEVNKKNSSDDSKIKNIPIEWITTTKKRSLNVVIIEKIIVILFIMIGFIISCIVKISNYIKF